MAISGTTDLGSNINNGGGGGSGVSSLNTLTGALTLVPGSGISIVAGGSTITISSTGAVLSINGDSTAAQTLTVGTAGTDFNIVDNGTGDHKFNLPTASAVNRGALSSADWSSFNTASTLVNASHAANTFLAAPSGGAGVATFRLIVPADVPTLNQNTTGSAASFTGSLSGDVTGTQSATVISSATVTGKLLTGYVSGRGLVAATDTILQAFDKLNGNDQIVYNDQTANYTIVQSDFNKIVRDTGSTAITFSITAAATLGAGWFCYLKNSSTGAENAGQLVIDPNAAELIDGQATITVYPGDYRLITCDGTAFTTRLLQGGAVEYTTAGAATFTRPTKTTIITVQLWGGGGGGGSGRRGAAASARSSGTGGGGGSYVEQDFKPVDVGTSATVTIAASAAGGAAITTDNTNGNAGAAGNNTTFGTLLTAYAGGTGKAGTAAAGNGAGGGGSLTAANVSTGGGPNPSTTQDGFGGGTGGTGSGSESGYGGGAGGGTAAGGAGTNGGCSFKGGPGGGSGGGISAADARQNGGDGGSGQGNVNGGGGLGGVGAGSAGANGTAGPSPLGPGTAGGGGASSLVGAGGVGGNGGIGAGGGGGAASLNGNNSGAGGSGGPGLCRIYYE